MGEVTLFVVRLCARGGRLAAAPELDYHRFAISRRAIAAAADLPGKAFRASFSVESVVFRDPMANLKGVPVETGVLST